MKKEDFEMTSPMMDTEETDAVEEYEETPRKAKKPVRDEYVQPVTRDESEDDEDEDKFIRMQVFDCAVLNLRSKPKISADNVIGKLSFNDIVRVDPTYKSDLYYKIVDPVKGYAMKRFFKTI